MDVLAIVTVYISVFFFFNDTATTEIYTLSLHDALPISRSGWRASTRCRSPDGWWRSSGCRWRGGGERPSNGSRPRGDRKSTRLNSSHANISYAVFCLKKKNNTATILGKSRTLIYTHICY